MMYVGRTLVLCLFIIMFLFSYVVVLSVENNAYTGFKWLSVRDYGNVIVVEEIFWIKAPYKYRNTVIMNNSDFMTYGYERYLELVKADKMLSMDPHDIIEPNATYTSIISELKDVLRKYGFRVAEVSVFGSGIIKLSVYRDQDITVDIVNEIKQVISKSILKDIRVVIHVLPFSYYSCSNDFMEKMQHAIKAVEDKYGDKLGKVKLDLGVGIAVLVTVHGDLAVSPEELVDYIRSELGDDSTPFILLFQDIRVEPLGGGGGNTGEYVSSADQFMVDTDSSGNNTSEGIQNSYSIDTSTSEENNGQNIENNVDNGVNLFFIVVIILVIVLLAFITYLRKR